MNRIPLPEGCLIKLGNNKNDIFEICGLIGAGGNALIYSARQVTGEETQLAKINYVIKECFPWGYERNSAYEIVSTDGTSSPEAEDKHLSSAKESMMSEAAITAEIYMDSARAAIAVFAISDGIDIYQNGWHHARNLVMLEEDLTEKGKPLSQYASRPLPVRASTFLLEQILLNLEEIHGHHFIHGDLSLSNIFIKGSLEKSVVNIIDFGCAQKLSEDGYTDILQTVMTSNSFSAPELTSGSRINETADLYAAGRIFLRLLLGKNMNPAVWDFERQAILTDATLRPTDVPPHLYRKLNQILSKALNPDPGARYLTAAAFLEDVKAFQEQIDFGLVRLYDSFDCYITYAEADRPLAVFLQNHLNDFEVKDENNGSRKPRLFLDQGEIAGYADQTIKETVDSSQYLLVIYSGRENYTEWMHQQVQVFRKSKGNERIIVWNLSKDDPTDSNLPGNSQIQYTGIDKDHPAKADLLPIAARITNKSLEQITLELKRKKLKKIALRAVFTAIAVSICLAFVLPIYHKLQISRNETKCEEAKTTCTRALNAYEEGDVNTATSLLDSTLTGSTYLVPEQLSLLTALTGSFDTGTYKYQPVDYLSSVKNVVLSTNGSRALYLSKDSNEIILENCDTGEELARFDYEGLGIDSFRSGRWLTDSKVILFSDENTVTLDSDTLSFTEFNLPVGYYRLMNVKDDDLAYVGYDSAICVVNTQTGINESFEIDSYCNDLTWSEDGHCLYAATETGLIKFDIDSRKSTLISDENLQEIYPLSSGALITLKNTDAAITADPRDSIGDLFPDKLSTFSLIKSDGTVLNLVTDISQSENNGIIEAALTISGTEQQVLLLHNGTDLYAFDMEGSIIFHTSYASEIVGCFVRLDGDILVTLDHGSVLELQNSIVKTEDTYEACIDSYGVYTAENYIRDAMYDREKDVLTLYTDDNLELLSRKADPDMEMLSAKDIFNADNVRISEVTYPNDGALSCRAVYGYEISGDLPLRYFFKDITYVSIYLPYESSPVVQYKARTGNEIKNVSVSEADGTVTIEEGPILYSEDDSFFQTFMLDVNDTPEHEVSSVSDSLSLTAEKNGSITNNLSYDTGFYGGELTLTDSETSLDYAVIENGFYDETSGEVSSLSHRRDQLYITHAYTYQELADKLHSN